MANNFSIFDFIFNLFENLKNTWYIIYDFLFYDVNFSWVNGFINWLENLFKIDIAYSFPATLSLWELMAGGGLVVILIFIVIKKIIPALG